MAIVLDHPDVSVRIEESGTRKSKISVEAKSGAFIPVRTWETAYPTDLIEHVLKVMGRAVADEIMRDEGSLYVYHHFKWNILSHVDLIYFAGRHYSGDSWQFGTGWRACKASYAFASGCTQSH